MTDVDHAKATTVKVTIDGIEVEASPDELIIDAADRVGTFIPRFCYHPHMEPVGMCRMCLVEVSGPRGFSLQPACYFKVTDGMEVRTQSDLSRKAQEGVLEFLLVNHPLDCPVCDKGGECPLQDQALSHGPGESRFIEEKRHWAKPIDIGPLVALDRERCIQCARCTRFADEVAGEALIDFFERGDKIEVAPFPGRPFSSYFGGNTVQICPVGALTAKPYRFKARPWDLEQVESTCTACSVGCRVASQSSAGQLVRYLGVDALSVNESWLCDKGRYSYESIYSPDRVVEPRVRRSAELEPATWGEALTRTAAALRASLATGPGRIGVIGGAHLSNEDAYAWSKLARTVLQTNSVNAQLGDGLPADVVLGLPKATIEETTRAEVVIVIAADVREELPVLYLRLRAALVAGQRVIVLSPLPTALEADGALRVGYLPGDLDHAVAALVGAPGGGAGEGLDPAEIAAARAALDGANDVVVVLGRPSLAESGVMISAAAAQLTSAMPKVRFLSALRRANIHGAMDMGLAPQLLPGRIALDDGRAALESAWGPIPTERGRDTEAMLRAAVAGEIDVLVLLGADPITDFPDAELARAGLEACPFVVGIATHTDPSTSHCDVVLPVPADGERSGTTTNLEGRVTPLAAKVVPPGVARAPWVIASELASRLGGDLGAESLEAFAEEIDELAPAYAGFVAALGDSPKISLIDPIATPGITSVTEQGAPMNVGSVEPPGGAEVTIDHAPEPDRPHVHFTVREPVFATRLDAYSHRLVLSRSLYDGGTTVRTSPSLAPLAKPPVVFVHPEELARLGVADGDRLRIRSAKGAIEATVEGLEGITRSVVALGHAAGEPGTSLVDAGDLATDVRLETL
jgi:NADH-quinone oxidoreductase subunit G